MSLAPVTSLKARRGASEDFFLCGIWSWGDYGWGGGIWGQGFRVMRNQSGNEAFMGSKKWKKDREEDIWIQLVGRVRRDCERMFI